MGTKLAGTGGNKIATVKLTNVARLKPFFHFIIFEIEQKAYN